MMIQMVDQKNATPIGQDRETLTLKALLYWDVVVHAQFCRLFFVRGVYPIVQFGNPAFTNIFVVDQIFRFNGVFAVSKTSL